MLKGRWIPDLVLASKIFELYSESRHSNCLLPSLDWFLLLSSNNRAAQKELNQRGKKKIGQLFKELRWRLRWKSSGFQRPTFKSRAKFSFFSPLKGPKEAKKKIGTAYFIIIISIFWAVVVA